MGSRKIKAFSLIELILVVSIVGVVSAIALPRLGSVLDTHRVDQAAARLANDLELLRTAARARSTTTTLTVNGKFSEWTLSGTKDPAAADPDSTVRLAEAPYFASFDSSVTPGELVLTFNPSGIPSQTYRFTIRSGAQSRSVTINRPGGAIEIGP